MIEIPGITINHEVIDMEDSTDQAHILSIKDQFGNIVVVNMSFGKITESASHIKP